MKRPAIFAAALALSLTPALADDTQADLETWGTMSPFKKTAFQELKYKAREFGKKPKTTRAYLKLDKAAFFVDQSVPLTAIEKGASVWIYGKPTERSSTDNSGRTQVDRQIVNTTVVAYGEALGIEADPKHKGPDDQIWLQAEVSKPGQALHVTYEGKDYKVVSLKSFSAFKRQALPKPPKKLKKKLLVAIKAEAIEERPEKAKAGVLTYTVKQIVILDKRIAKAVYPLLFR